MPGDRRHYLKLAVAVAAQATVFAASPAFADPVAYACDNGKSLSIDIDATGGARIDYDGKTYTLKKISGGVDGLTFKTGDVAVWSKETDLIITIGDSPLQCVQI